MAEQDCSLHQEFNNSEGGLFLSYSIDPKNTTKIACALRRIFPDHGRKFKQSIELVMAGDLEGSIRCETPGVFEIACGEVPAGKTGDYAGIAGLWSAQNGDIVLAAPKGSVRIIAQNIELLSNGDQGKTGHVSVVANGKFRTYSRDLDLEAVEKAAIVSEVGLNIIGSGGVTVEGGGLTVEEGSDVKGVPGVSAVEGGSKTNIEWFRQYERFFKKWFG